MKWRWKRGDLDVIKETIVRRFERQGAEGEADALVGSGPDDPLAVQIVLVSVRMIGRRKSSAHSRQQSTAARNT